MMTRNNAIKLLKEAGWHSDFQKEKVVADIAELNPNKARDYFDIGASNRVDGRPCTCERCNLNTTS
jgi:hypothetical protein